MWFPQNAQTPQKPTGLSFSNPQNSLRFAMQESTEMNACRLDYECKDKGKKRATVMIRGQYDIRHFKIIIHKKMLLVTKMVSIQKKITIFALK